VRVIASSGQVPWATMPVMPLSMSHFDWRDPIQLAKESDPAQPHSGNWLREYSKLSREEAMQLYCRYRDNRDEQAERYLVRAHKRYAIAIALQYCGLGLPLSELVAEGESGIVHALTKFDSQRGPRLLTYVAYWVRGCILNHIIHAWASVEFDRGASRSNLFKLRRQRTRMAHLLGDGDDAAGLFAERVPRKRKRAATVTSADSS
jgi:RNA polymerase sigma-32 factor